MKEFKSDRNGELLIPEDIIKTTIHDNAHLYWENIFINMKSKNKEAAESEVMAVYGEWPFFERNSISRPNSLYQGLVVRCDDSSKKVDDYRNIRLDWTEEMKIGNSFSKKAEEITVRLKRVDNNDE